MKYYKFENTYYWADENTKITQGSIEITKDEFYASFAPKLQTVFTPLQFLEKFTESEQLAVVSATMANPQVKLWYDKLLSALDVNIEDERLIAGMNALVQFGLITQDRANEILER